MRTNAALPAIHSIAVSRYHFLTRAIVVHTTKNTAKTNATYSDAPAAEASAIAAGTAYRHAPAACQSKRKATKHAVNEQSACGVPIAVPRNQSTCSFHNSILGRTNGNRPRA